MSNKKTSRLLEYETAMDKDNLVSVRNDYSAFTQIHMPTTLRETNLHSHMEL